MIHGMMSDDVRDWVTDQRVFARECSHIFGNVMIRFAVAVLCVVIIHPSLKLLRYLLRQEWGTLIRVLEVVRRRECAQDRVDHNKTARYFPDQVEKKRSCRQPTTTTTTTTMGEKSRQSVLSRMVIWRFVTDWRWRDVWALVKSVTSTVQNHVDGLTLSYYFSVQASFSVTSCVELYVTVAFCAQTVFDGLTSKMTHQRRHVKGRSMTWRFNILGTVVDAQERVENVVVGLDRSQLEWSRIALKCTEIHWGK